MLHRRIRRDVENNPIARLHGLLMAFLAVVFFVVGDFFLHRSNHAITPFNRLVHRPNSIFEFLKLFWEMFYHELQQIYYIIIDWFDKIFGKRGEDDPPDPAPRQ